jgi:hypothetical protein
MKISCEDIVLNISHLDSALFQMYIKSWNVSDVNIEKIFEIRHSIVDIILTVYSLYRARKERYSLFSYI